MENGILYEQDSQSRYNLGTPTKRNIKEAIEDAYKTEKEWERD